ncbi:MAG TPA: hypothetical protein ENO07_04205, partial [candidate division Zixibacteria bacterium]|nr:hypothetical protein [candidate division Zixibacteria bacterium]
MKDQIISQEHFLSGECAFTGRVDADGKITAVKEDSLSKKIGRAFFSHVKYLALPEANIRAGQEIRDSLRQQYPKRQLKLIPLEWLSEALCNRNIIITEKVCLLNRVSKGTRKYSRMAKVQVPLLGILVVILAAFTAIQIDPRLSPWFDYHISGIKVMGNQFQTINSEGKKIWDSEKFDRPFNKAQYENSAQLIQVFRPVDIDRNGRDELFFVPVFDKEESLLFFYDSRGRLEWKVTPFQKTAYPGDKAYPGVKENLHYHSVNVFPIIDNQGETFALTAAFTSLPAREQIILYDCDSNIVSGPYILTGSFIFETSIKLDINRDGQQDVLVYGTNNRHEGCGIVVLDPKNLQGVSPPYDNKLFIMSGMPKGSQLRYIAFPETQLSEKEDVRTGILHLEFDEASGAIKVPILEGRGLIVDGSFYEPRDQMSPMLFYDLDSNFIPTGITFNDGTKDHINDLLKRTNRAPIEDFEDLRDSLLSEV